MNALTLTKTAYQSLGKNKFRTFLTMLGIIIGVGAVILMQAIGKGTEAVINSKIASLGTNLIFITPDAGKDNGVALDLTAQQTLKIDDVYAIKKKCKNVAFVSPVIRTSSIIKFGGNNSRTTVMGVSEDYLGIRNIKLVGGVCFNENDTKASAKFCLIGKTIKEKLFTHYENPLGKTIRVGLIPFKIVGILEEKGQSGFGQDQDDIILAPYSSVKNRITGLDYIQQIYVSSYDGKSVPIAVQEIRQAIRSEHKLAATADDDFKINTQSEIAETAKTITGTLTVLLASIAAISLLVGGIGIMNIMLVSVTERTREIGIRLAIGATALDILTQLLIEAVVLSVTAGLFGVLFGVGVTTLLSSLTGWETVVSVQTEVTSFIICTLIGVFFGWYPARKAARLNPIDALRYE